MPEPVHDDGFQITIVKKGQLGAFSTTEHSRNRARPIKASKGRAVFLRNTKKARPGERTADIQLGLVSRLF